jgi:hypothetical protein
MRLRVMIVQVEGFLNDCSHRNGRGEDGAEAFPPPRGITPGPRCHISVENKARARKGVSGERCR